MSRYLLFVACLCLPATANAQEAFDKKDAKKTAAWVASLWEPIFDSISKKNYLAKKMAEASMDATLAKIIGQDVDWQVSVGSVGQGVTFQKIVSTKHIINLTAPRKLDARYGPGNFPYKADWLAKLAKGDPIRLEGKIVGVRRQHSDSMPTVQIFIGGYTLTPKAK